MPIEGASNTNSSEGADLPSESIPTITVQDASSDEVTAEKERTEELLEERVEVSLEMAKASLDETKQRLAEEKATASSEVAALMDKIELLTSGGKSTNNSSLTTFKAHLDLLASRNQDRQKNLEEQVSLWTERVSLANNQSADLKVKLELYEAGHPLKKIQLTDAHYAKRDLISARVDKAAEANPENQSLQNLCARIRGELAAMSDDKGSYRSSQKAQRPPMLLTEEEATLLQDILPVAS